MHFSRAAWLIVVVVLAPFLLAIMLGYYQPITIFFYSLSGNNNMAYPSSVEQVASHILENCKDGARKTAENKETCYSVEFSKLAFQNGPIYAFGVLYALQNQDKDANGCHFIAHGIGYGTYKRNPNDWQKDITTIKPACSYGAPMGIIELYAASLPGGAFTGEFIQTICGRNPRADCNHIIGHLLLADASIKGDIEKALLICHVFSDKTQRKYCQTGVFMENITALNLIAHGYADKFFLNWPARLPAIEKLCRAHKDEEAVACWEESAHAIIAKFPMNPGLVFDFCNSAPSVEASYQCKRHAFGIIAGTKNFDISSLTYMCELPQPSNDPTFAADCYNGLSMSAISSTPEKADYVISFCAAIPAKYRAGCFAQIGGALLFMGRARDEIVSLCHYAKETGVCEQSIVKLNQEKTAPVPTND